VTSPCWLERRIIDAVHDAQLAQFGGAGGICDAGLLESALAWPLNLHAYGEGDLCILAAAYAFGIVRNHPFVDGNKRTGFVAAALFLMENRLRLTAPEAEAVVITLGLASGEMPEAGFFTWLRDWTEPL
jgi:death-on-curing protein